MGSGGSDDDSAGSTLKGACCGLIMIPVLILLTSWNEFNLVISEATADIVKKDAHIVPNCKPIGSENSELVYTSCEVSAPDLSNSLPDTLRPFFADGYHGAALDWVVEIYQWKETRHKECRKEDGHKECHHVYTHTAGWHHQAIDSNQFDEIADISGSYNNHGTALPINLQGGSVKAPDHSVTMHPRGDNSGAFYALPRFVADQLPNNTVPAQTHPKDEGLQTWSGFGTISTNQLLAQGDFITTAHTSPPQIGDIRIKVTGKMSDEASVAAQQAPFDGKGFTFVEYPPQKFDMWGRHTFPVARLSPKSESLKDFVKEWHAENQIKAWIIRLLTLAAFVFACFSIMKPISQAASVLEYMDMFTCGLGSLIESAVDAVIGAVACGLGCGVWMMTVAFAWIFVHPTVSLAVMAFGLCAFCVLPQISARSMKKTNAREHDYYVKMGGVSFNSRKVQPTFQVV